MAKKASSIKLPKRIAGMKVPKRVRRSVLIRGLLSSVTGREIASKALLAGAGAAAAALVTERHDLAAAPKAAGRQGTRHLTRLSDAAESGFNAALAVVMEAASTLAPGKHEGGEVRH